MELHRVMNVPEKTNSESDSEINLPLHLEKDSVMNSEVYSEIGLVWTRSEVLRRTWVQYGLNLNMGMEHKLRVEVELGVKPEHKLSDAL